MVQWETQERKPGYGPAAAGAADPAALEAQQQPPLHTLPVWRKIGPGQHGSMRWTALHGADLVCVRYRSDPTTGERFTTLEVLVERRDARKGAAMVQPHPQDADLDTQRAIVAPAGDAGRIGSAARSAASPPGQTLERPAGMACATPTATMWVRVLWREAELRALMRAHGARWLPQCRLWETTAAKAEELRLVDRIVWRADGDLSTGAHGDLQTSRVAGDPPWRSVDARVDF